MTVPFAVDPTEIRRFVVQLLSVGAKAHLAKQLQDRFSVSRATAHNYIRELVAAGIIERTKPGHYQLASKSAHIIHAIKGLEEDEVWRNEILPLLEGLPVNVVNIWRFGCTEMINNAIDHSESPGVLITIKRTDATVEIDIHDRGVGIFRKIATALGLEDDRHAVLELSKGKVTTDPVNHTGEGIFFSSRAFDSFKILSGGVLFNHESGDDKDWILGDETPHENVNGTSVYMTLKNDSDRALNELFAAYATDDDAYGFDKTIVPIKLLQYGDDHLVSRSQAKRLLRRFDRFKTVVLNFQDVESIGQAFADEVFRVFQAQHPEVELIPINANEQVARMLNRAINKRQPQRDLFASGDRDPREDGPQDGNG
jgi:anti-sigma regulatory factor (Ser/Thr protein kinase)